MSPLSVGAHTRARVAMAVAAPIAAALILAAPVSALEPIAVRGARFETARTHRPFVVYGFNYGTGAISPTERYLAHRTPARLAAIVADLRKMHGMGANVARVYVQLGDVMATPTAARPGALAALRRVADAAAAAGLRLEVTGNLVWRPAAAPPWYDRLHEQARWQVQETFWRWVAGALTGSSGVFAYELTSEPAVADGVDRTAPHAWYDGAFGGLFYVQRISLAARGRVPAAIARAWTARLARAVRTADPRHLVTIGLLPDPNGSFRPRDMGRLLDFVCIHVYPRTGQAASDIAVVHAWTAARKPVLIGETFQLFDDPATQARFLLGTRHDAAGWLAFFNGRTPGDMGTPRTIPDAMYKNTLEQFMALRGRLIRPVGR